MEIAEASLQKGIIERTIKSFENEGINLVRNGFTSRLSRLNGSLEMGVAGVDCDFMQRIRVGRSRGSKFVQYVVVVPYKDNPPDFEKTLRSVESTLNQSGIMLRIYDKKSKKQFLLTEYFN